MKIPFVDLQAQYAAIKDEVLAALAEAIAGMELMLGPNVRALETEFAAYVEARHAIGVGSGTDAVYLALRACGIRPGDEVITVAHTFFATAEAILMIGAVPVYVDVDPVTYTMDPAKIGPAVTSRTRAIVPVHLYGQMADMDAIMGIAQQYGLAVVEDACQAHGATDRGRPAGSIGDAAAFSFYMSKNLGAYGEGGMVTTNSHALADSVRLLRNHGSRIKYEHEEVGTNSRLDELQAAILRIKLRRLDTWNALRRIHAEMYDELLAKTNVTAPGVREGAQHVYHLYVIRTEERDRLRDTLTDLGIATGIHYPIPIHLQTAARGAGRVAGNLSVTEALCGQILSLPMYAELTAEQVSFVAASVRAAGRVRSFEGLPAFPASGAAAAHA